MVKKVIGICCTGCYRGRKCHLTKRGNDCRSAKSEIQGYVLENCRWEESINTVFPSPPPCFALQSTSELAGRPAWNINPCHIGELQMERNGKQCVEVIHSERPVEMGHQFNSARHWNYFWRPLLIKGWQSVDLSASNVTSDTVHYSNQWPFPMLLLMMRGFMFWSPNTHGLVSPCDRLLCSNRVGDI